MKATLIYIKQSGDFILELVTETIEGTKDSIMEDACAKHGQVLIHMDGMLLEINSKPTLREVSTGIEL